MGILNNRASQNKANEENYTNYIKVQSEKGEKQLLAELLRYQISTNRYLEKMNENLDRITFIIRIYFIFSIVAVLLYLMARFQ